MAEQSLQAWLEVIEQAKAIFTKKLKDYGSAWSGLRPISLIDQLFIKANRIRTISLNKEQKVNNTGDDIISEYLGIVNYGIIGLIQLQNPQSDGPVKYLPNDEALNLYEKNMGAIVGKLDFANKMVNGAKPAFLVEIIYERLRRISDGYQSKKISKDNEETMISHHLEKIIMYAIFAKAQLVHTS